MDLSGLINRYAQWTELFLNQRVIPLIQKEGVPEVCEPAIYSLQGGGKRVRPMLLLMAASHFPDETPSLPESGSTVERAFFGAAAVEVLHTYSLIHDDLPAMDNDDLRRGRPSCHKAFSDWAAILAGDALNTFSFQLLVRCMNPGEPEKAVRLVEILSRAGGLKGMVSGQALDLAAEKGGGTTPVENPHKLLEMIHRKKTAAMIGASMEMGALLGGLPETHLHAKYGEELGLLFQITDDILDVTSNSKTLGKTVGKDAANNKLTYPALYGLEESRKKASLLAHELRDLALALPLLSSSHEHDFREIFLRLPDYIQSRTR